MEVDGVVVIVIECVEYVFCEFGCVIIWEEVIIDFFEFFYREIIVG